MPASFRGTEVSLQKIVLEGKTTGAFLSIDVRFEDKNGVVHAITRHQLEATVDPKVAAAAKALYESLKSWVESVHFEGSSTPTPERVTPRGIAESVLGATDSADDPVGQG